jgi:hypothetical protein
MKFLKESILVLSILLFSSPLALTYSFGSTTNLTNSYGLLFVPTFSPSNHITEGSNMWIVAWTANFQTGGILIIITSPNGSENAETFGASPCTIPLVSESNGLCSIEEINSLARGIYRVEVYIENNVEGLEGDIYRTFNVTLGSPVTTPEPTLPLDIKKGGPFSFGLMFNPQLPEISGSNVTLTAWTGVLAPGYVVFSVKAPGGSPVNTTVALSSCTIPQRHRTSGLCAQLVVGPLVSGVYITESGFHVIGGENQRASIYGEMVVT